MVLSIAANIIWIAYRQIRYGRWFKMQQRLFHFMIKNKLKKCGQSVTIHPNVEIRSPENITIGDHTNINHNSELYGGGGISIGSGSMLSYYVTVLSDYRSYRGDRRLMDPSRLKERVKKHTTIGNDVWIGTKATILPGVAIDDHAIVAAGSVVTKSVASWDIVAGNPAKVVGNRLEETR